MLAGRRPSVQTMITMITPMAAPVPERTQNQRQEWLSRHHLNQMLQTLRRSKRYRAAQRGNADHRCHLCSVKHQISAGFSLLNEVREDLETIIRRVCKENGEYQPRSNCHQARKNYALAKCRKRKLAEDPENNQKAARIYPEGSGYVDSYLDEAMNSSQREDTSRYDQKVYDQQKYMYDIKLTYRKRQNRKHFSCPST